MLAERLQDVPDLNTKGDAPKARRNCLALSAEYNKKASFNTSMDLLTRMRNSIITLKSGTI